MSRVKRGVTSHAKHKKVYKLAKGFRGRRKNTIRTAKAAVEKAAQYASHVERIEARLRVVEEIVTDGGAQTAAQIEALRDHRRERVRIANEDKVS